MQSSRISFCLQIHTKLSSTKCYSVVRLSFNFRAAMGEWSDDEKPAAVSFFSFLMS